MHTPAFILLPESMENMLNAARMVFIKVVNHVIPKQ